MTGERLVEVFQDSEGFWWWHVVAANGSDILSDSGEGYVDYSEARRMAEEMNPNLRIMPPGESGDGDPEP